MQPEITPELMKTAMDAAIAIIDRSARRAAFDSVRRRARAYARQPWQLNALFAGLSEMEPADMIEAIRAASRRERAKVAHFDITGGAIPKINLRAAMIVARWRRRFEPSSTLRFEA